VIVRIATEGQYEIPDEVYEELNGLDNQTVDAVQAGDEAAFDRTYRAMLDLVRTRGRQLEATDLRESALILPPPDLRLSDAVGEFSGEGLLPD
jgi:hypothetical protein